MNDVVVVVVVVPHSKAMRPYSPVLTFHLSLLSSS